MPYFWPISPYFWVTAPYFSVLERATLTQSCGLNWGVPTRWGSGTKYGIVKIWNG